MSAQLKSNAPGDVQVVPSGRAVGAEIGGIDLTKPPARPEEGRKRSPMEATCGIHEAAAAESRLIA